MEEITSRANPLIAHVRKLQRDRQYRRATGEAACEGPKLLAEALRWGAAVTTLFYCPGAALPEGLPEAVRRVRVPEQLLRYLSETESPQGLLFLCGIPSLSLPEALPRGRYLLLDGLQDPGNLGTIWRTADAFGAEGLILLPGCADPWGGKALRAAMGASFRLPLWEAEVEEAAAALEQAGIPLWAAAVQSDSADITAAPLERAAVVIGSEGRGVSPAVLAQCRGTVRIPMEARCESLNAAVAAAVILWQMREGGPT